MFLNDHVILVDANDEAQGTMEKIEAHQKGELHRAFSIFVINSKNELLLQKRSPQKYHSGGKWTNACCSHPRENETLEEAAHRRLQEEMGFDCDIDFLFSFIYKSELDNAFIEHELDHVFIGKYDGKPTLNSDEASDWKFESLANIEKSIAKKPDSFSVWFKMALPRVKKHLSL